MTTIGAKPTSPDRLELYSEADVVSKVVVPDLATLGYVEGTTRHGRVVIRHAYPINAQSGREKKTIFADLVIFVDDVPVIVVDAKNPREFLTDNDREQVVSYARAKKFQRLHGSVPVQGP